MLYVCSVPVGSIWDSYPDTPVYIIDIVKGDRGSLSNKSWSVYQTLFGHDGIWIITSSELCKTKITTIKWHKGETA